MASTENEKQPAAAAPEFLAVDGERIAVRHRPGKQPAIFWLSGYRSDMMGTKAQALDQWTAQRGLAFTRHDYSGHGESSGLYHEGSISKWLAQSMAVFRRYALPAGRRHILVGSSMGAWIALRMVQELNGGKKAATAEQPGTPPPIAGLLLLAPAPDFTAELMEPELSAAERQQLQTEGFYEEKSEYFPENPCIWTRHFFEDARQHNSVLSRPLEPGCPVHIVHGLRDRDVPVKLVDKLEAQLPAADDGSVQRTTVPEGDHRLSREEDIELILRCLDGLVQKATAMDG